jgi:hypothetical protein
MRFGEPAEGSSLVRDAPFCLFWEAERSIIGTIGGGLLFADKVRRGGRRRI